MTILDVKINNPAFRPVKKNRVTGEDRRKKGEEGNTFNIPGKTEVYRALPYPPGLPSLGL
jgi:hypothetical protein